MIKEACIENLGEAIKAESEGASQLELCDRLDLDGSTPTFETIEEVCSAVNIPVKVIVNPVPFQYQYSETQARNILKTIERLNQYPISGIVFGPLTKEGLPDLKLIKRVSEHTEYPITFHKAIDQTKNILTNTQAIADHGIVKYILSSGGSSTAEEGSQTLLKMKAILADTPTRLIAAGKVTDINLPALHKRLSLEYYHGRKIVGSLS